MVLGKGVLLKWNFSGSNTFGAMKICSTQGYFELMSIIIAQGQDAL